MSKKSETSILVENGRFAALELCRNSALFSSCFDNHHRKKSVLVSSSRKKPEIVSNTN
jgi:hypothetical protein